MALRMLGSLALMLQLLATALHLVSMATPAWIQFWLDLPPFDTLGRLDLPPFDPLGRNQSSSSHNDTSEVSMVMTENGYGGGYLKVRLGFLEWCQQFRYLSPACQEPEFLPVVGVLAFCGLTTLCLALMALMYTACLDVGTRRYRTVNRTSCFFSLLSAMIILAIVATYSIYGGREVDKIMTERGLSKQLPFLGWAFGAIAVTGILETIAAGLILLDLRRAHPGFKGVEADDKDVREEEG